MLLRSALGPGVTSLEEIRTAAAVSRPASVRVLVDRYTQPIVFDEPLITPGGVALGGHHTITLNHDGHFVHEGEMRATGFPSFTFGVRSVIESAAGPPLVFAANGRVHGTNEPGNRESTWRISGTNGLIPLHWHHLRSGRVATAINREADFFGAFGDVLGFVATIAGGAVVAGGAGVCLMLGVHGADLAGLDEQLGIAGLAGVVVAAGTLVVVGPGAIVPAIVAGAAAGVAVELALEHRAMRDEEVRFARQVFGDTIPFGRIRLTNLLGAAGRPFTIPSIGDTILVNIGAGFQDPVRYTGFGDPDNPNVQAPGQLFIHELVHAWQIATTTFLPGLLCDATGVQLTTLGGNMGIYRYGPPDQNYGEFNTEQRASIVDDWFAGSGKQAAFKAMSETNPYFRYIRDNIKLRLP